MFWTNNTHDCAATYCKRLGRPCPAAIKMLNSLSASLSQAQDVTEEDFEMSGQVGLNACDSGCTARFVASHDRIRVFCGVEDSADQSALDQCADAMLLDVPLAPSTLRKLSACPIAMAQALPLRAAASAPAEGDAACL